MEKKIWDFLRNHKACIRRPTPTTWGEETLLPS